MSHLSDLSLAAFLAGRKGFGLLRSSPALVAFAEVPRIRFAAGVGANARLAKGKPRSVECTWDDFCESVRRYSEVVVGARQQDKLQHSAYLIAGELARDGREGVLAGRPGGSSRVSGKRDDTRIARITMLVLDCDQPASAIGLARFLSGLKLAYCITPTWSWTVDRPKWRLFIPVGPVTADHSAMGSMVARLRYAWLAGVFAEAGGLPRDCVDCMGHGAGGMDKALQGGACAACKGSGYFMLDLSCWNYSRLHFLGGLRIGADATALGREVLCGAGFALDVEAWLEGSGWAEWFGGAVGFGSSTVGGLSSVGPLDDSPHMAFSTDDEEDVTGSVHSDPELSAAMTSCSIPLWERVRRAAAYVGASSFPPSISGARGHDALMRACSVVCSGFLVPLGGGLGADGWADRVLQISFNPRCVPAWSEGEIRRKVRHVRLGTGQTAGALLNGEALGRRFYLVGSLSGLDEPVKRAGRKPSTVRILSDRGADQGTISPELAELLSDAALACTVDPYDPREVPEGLVRAVVGPSAGGRCKVGSQRRPKGKTA